MTENNQNKVEKDAGQKFLELLNEMPSQQNHTTMKLTKSTRDVPSLLQSIYDFDKDREDVPVNVKSLRMLDNGSLITPEQQVFNFGDYSLSQFCTFLNIPAHYIKRLLREKSDLVAPQVNHFLSKYNEDDLRVFRMKKSRIQGIVSPTYKTIDDHQALEFFLEAAKDLPDAEITNFFRNDKYMHMRVTFPDLNRNYGKNTHGKEDIIRVCVDIRNSEVGARSFTANDGVYRLVCTNGMLRPVGETHHFYQQHRGFDLAEVRGKFISGINSSLEQGKVLLEQMDAIRSKKIELPYLTIEGLGKRANLTKKQIEVVKNNFDVEPEKSLYGIINAFTATARDLKNNERRIQLEEFAGRLLQDKKLQAFADKTRAEIFEDESVLMESLV